MLVFVAGPGGVGVGGPGGKGLGPWLPTASAAKATAPSVPRSLVATSADAAVKLSWAAPATTGGAAVSDYVIQYKRTSATSWVTYRDAVSAARSVTVTRLTNGTAYHFRVAAKNKVGLGKYTAAVAQIPATVPSAPRSLVAASADAAVKLSWAAPAATGGAAVSDYVIQYKRTTATTWVTYSDAVSTARSVTVTRLTNGAAYHFRVAAKNKAGRGAYTAGVAQTPATVPSAPRSLVSAPADAGVKLSWVAPATSGGAAVTDYAIQYKRTSATTWVTFSDPVSTATTTTVTGLEVGVSYDFRVAARNRQGAGPYSAPVTRALAPTLPGLTGLMAAGGPSQVVLTWDATALAPLARVEVQTAAAEAGPWTTRVTVDGRDGSATIPGLANGTTVYLRARPTGPELSVGPWSGAISAVPHQLTSCGTLTADEVWPDATHSPTCVVTTGEHTLLIQSGATVHSRGINVSPGGTLRVDGRAGIDTAIDDACVDDPNCTPEIRVADGTVQVSHAAISVRRVHQSNATMLWSQNRFVGTVVESWGGKPRLVGNSFAGAEFPVQVFNPVDVAGIKGNTASGSPKERRFEYSGGQVAGHWTPEGAGSGVIHYLNSGSVVDGGHAEMGPGVIVKITGWTVESGGKLTMTGDEDDQPLITRACDADAGGDTGCPLASPDDKGSLTLDGGAVVAVDRGRFAGLYVLLGAPFTEVTAVGTVTRSTVTNSHVKHYIASLLWSENRFVGTVVESWGGKPRLVGNSFAGAEFPVQVFNPVDVAGIKGNTASGSPKERRFEYSGGQVAGHWTPEGAGSGVIHYLNSGSVVDGGHAEMGPGVIVKITGWTVESGGKLTMTGDEDDQPLITRACDADAGGDTGCPLASPDDKGSLTLDGGAVVAVDRGRFAGLYVLLGAPFTEVTAVGTVTRSTVTNSHVKHYIASLLWSENRFVGTVVESWGGKPRLVGNSFAGAEFPVQVFNPVDVAGIKGNTASGSPKERRFEYSGGQVAGHWTPEGAGSGVIHYLNSGSVVDGGHAEMGPGVIVKITGWTVESGGKLTMTGDEDDQPLITRACDADAGGDTGCPLASPDGRGTLTIRGGSTVSLVKARWNTVDASLGTAAPEEVATDGSVTDSTFTDVSVTAHPASLTWVRNDLDNTQWSARNGDSVVLQENSLVNGSTVRIDGVGAPELDKNRATGIAHPVIVTDADDLSKVAPTNRATGTTDDMRRLRFDSSTVKAGTSMTVPAADMAIYGFQSLDVDGQLSVVPGAVVDISGDLDVERGGQLTATAAEFRSLEAAFAEMLEAEPGGSINITASRIEGE